jgi:hypothetical protein
MLVMPGMHSKGLEKTNRIVPSGHCNINIETYRLHKDQVEETESNLKERFILPFTWY